MRFTHHIAAFDYGFPSVKQKAGKEDPAITSLVGFDKKTKALMAVYAREKGAKDRYQVDSVKHFLQENAHECKTQGRPGEQNGEYHGKGCGGEKATDFYEDHAKGQ